MDSFKPSVRPQVAEYFARMNAKPRKAETKDVNCPTVGEWITDAIIELKMSDPLLGKTIGITPSSIGNYKRGHIPQNQSASFESFCGFMGIDPIAARQDQIKIVSGIPLRTLVTMLQKLQTNPDLYNAAAASIKALASSPSGKSAR